MSDLSKAQRDAIRMLEPNAVRSIDQADPRAVAQLVAAKIIISLKFDERVMYGLTAEGERIRNGMRPRATENLDE